jgi:hypothetical protein
MVFGIIPERRSASLRKRVQLHRNPQPMTICPLTPIILLTGTTGKAVTLVILLICGATFWYSRKKRGYSLIVATLTVAFFVVASYVDGYRVMHLYTRMNCDAIMWEKDNQEIPHNTAVSGH